MILPPYGRQFIDNPPSAGLWVAVGPGAWNLAKSKPFPVVVLPIDKRPCDYEWPSVAGAALIFETGSLNDKLLHELAQALVLAGANSVVAIRESLLRSRDCCLFFEAVPYGDE